LLFPIFEWLERWFPPLRWVVLRNRRLVDSALLPVIAAHRARPRADLLSMLIEAGMSDEWVRDQAVTLLLAGIETTANALAWTLHLLALHPDVQRAVGEELATVLGGRAPEVADLAKLPLLERVLLESLRLYPPNWMISRLAREDVSIGGWQVPAGATCLVSQFVVHRDERWFPSPESFDPARWERRPRASLPRYAYFPFGGGSRMCVGEHFALLEATLVLATLLQRWELLAVPGRQVTPDPGITLRPLPGPRVRVLPR
jgi:cytochrome P450